MWGLLIAEGVLLGGSYIYHRWIEEHPIPRRPANVALPRVDLGAPPTLLYGRCQTRAPIAAWSGNYVIPVEGNPLYKLDVMFIVGVPFFGGKASSPFNNIWAGDIKLGALTSPTLGAGEQQNFAASAGAEFAAVDVVGEFYSGSPTQNVGESTTRTRAKMLLAGIDGTLIPGFRSQVIFSFVGVGGSPADAPGLTIGTTPQVPGFRFEVIALSTDTPSDMGQSLTEEADPAAVLYDLLTSPWGKLGLSADQIDRPSFEACSLTMFNEGLGYSRAFEDSQSASEMIAEVLKHADGAIYQEPTTGKLVMRLARFDYNVDDLVDMNPTNVSLSNYQVQGWNEIPNQVRVTFTQREANYADGLEIGQNEAQAVAQGGRRRPVDLRFPGCCTREQAKKLASRELAFVARPQVKATVVTDRSFYQTRLLDVFTLSWPDLGIDKMVMRVARVDFGQLHDGKITIDLIKEVTDPAVGAFP